MARLLGKLRTLDVHSGTEGRGSDREAHLKTLQAVPGVAGHPFANQCVGLDKDVSDIQRRDEYHAEIEGVGGKTYHGVGVCGLCG